MAIDRRSMFDGHPAVGRFVATQPGSRRRFLSAAKMPRFGGYGRYGGYSGGFSSYGGGYGFGGSRYFEDYWAREAERDAEMAVAALAKEARASGSRRREVELMTLGRTLPEGPWDADCEAYPEKTYSWDLGAGFKGTIMRNLVAWTWCGYVELPEWYPERHRPYDFWNGEDPTTGGPGSSAAPPALPGRPPMELSYGNMFESPPGKYGFDHSWGRDRQPLAKPGACGSGAECFYTDAPRAIEEVTKLASYFASMVLDGSLGVPADIMTANREGLMGIQQQEMRLMMKRREAKAAAKAAEKAAKAADGAAGAGGPQAPV